MSVGGNLSGRHGFGAAFGVAALVFLALVAAACGGGGSSGSHVAQVGSTAAPSGSSSNHSGASTPEDGALGFSRCMRSKGVSSFPDPDSSGAIPKVSPQELGVSSSQFQAAQTACHGLLPTVGSLQQEANCIMLGNCPAALVRQMLPAERKYAQCMRSHGVRNWPDPVTNSQGMPVFNVTHAGIDRQFIHSPLFRSPNNVCQRLTGGAPVPRE
jgi:hypothetical protein